MRYNYPARRAMPSPTCRYNPPDLIATATITNTNSTNVVLGSPQHGNVTLLHVVSSL